MLPDPVSSFLRRTPSRLRPEIGSRFHFVLFYGPGVFEVMRVLLFTCIMISNFAFVVVFIFRVSRMPSIIKSMIMRIKSELKVNLNIKKFEL